MNKHDSEDELLDQLYSKSAKEQPPSHLDKKILAEAKARYQPGTLAASFKWQRILSVAAVMVLSIYVFFDVNDNRMPNINSELYYQQGSQHEESPNTSGYMSKEQHLQDKEKSKKSKKNQQQASETTLEIEADEFSEDKILEQRALSKSKPKGETQGQSKTNTRESRALSSPAAQQQKRDFKAGHVLEAENIGEISGSIEENAERHDAGFESKAAAPIETAKKQKKRIEHRMSELTPEPNTSTEAEKIIKEIQQLLANGDLEAARKRYDKFKLRFPEHTVPASIEHFFYK